MKALLTVGILLFSSPALAITYEIIGACSSTPEAQGTDSITKPESAGRVTLEILEKEHLPYVGTEAGIQSIGGTPTGDDALEVVSNDEMYAYGWCFEVNNVQPKKMPDEIVLQGKESLRWFYAYSRYIRGNWVDYCTPAWTRKLKNICG